MECIVAFNNITLSRMPMTVPSDEDFRLQVSTVVSQVIYVLRLVVHWFATAYQACQLYALQNFGTLIAFSKPFTTEIPFDEGGI
jgi:hypothetical protein